LINSNESEPVRKRAKKQKPYFTEKTENAIVRYNTSENSIEKNIIYQTEIHAAFDKLAENLIHTFKFYNFDIEYEDVKHEVVTFLVEKINKYSPEKGKAFSYFSIVGKNYLIANNNYNYHYFKKITQIDAIDTERSVINEVLREDIKEEKADFFDLFVEYFDLNIHKLFTKQRDLEIADAVIDLFRNRQNIENFNKKALYILIRERTNVKTQNVTSIINKIKKVYSNLYYHYNNNIDILTIEAKDVCY
jgi:hypothetical protein